MPSEVIDQFSVSHLRILDEAGNVDEELDPGLSREKLLQIYRAMLLSREGDQRMLKLQRQGRIGTFGPGTGQEASSVGAAFAMGDSDWLVGAFREMGARLVRGDSLTNALIYYAGYEEGSLLEDPSARVLPINIIVASQLVHAAGIGYAMKYRNERAAVVAFFGDGATSQGDFHEALNFAAVWQAPVVFLCQNNQWAISIPRSQQTRSRTLAQKAIAYDIPGIQIDGNDVLAVYKATRDALERAYAGEGPTLIEAVTYRLMMHTTADDPTRYRSEDEVNEWWKRDPIPRLRKYLENKGYWDAEQQAGLEEEIRQQVEAAVQEFESPREYQPDTPFDHVFGTRHEVIEEQRREFLAHLGKEAADA